MKFKELLSYFLTFKYSWMKKRIPGSFILTGSHQLQLSQAISQSLAGRTALLELLPLSINELANNGVNQTTNEYLLKGFFPAIYQHHLKATTHSNNYIKTYVERDVRQIINIKDLHSFHRFIKLCAGRVSSTINRESLGNDVGVSQNTIKSWLSILEASYITYHLQPYFENFGKRVIKSSKLYFLDVGIISYLLDIHSDDQMNHDRLRGSIFENMVVLEILKYQYNQGKDASIYFYRDSHGNEVDVIFKIHNKLIPIEIKSTSTFNSSLLKGVKYFKKLVGNKAPLAFLIYTGEQEQRIGDIQVMNYKNIHKVMHMITELSA